jgi:hypothetical protein
MPPVLLCCNQESMGHDNKSVQTVKFSFIKKISFNIILYQILQRKNCYTICQYEYPIFLIKSIKN